VSYQGQKRLNTSNVPIEQLYDLIESHEDWLINRILYYANKRDYIKYTSTQAENWRASIAGLSAALLQTIEMSSDPPELGPDNDFTKNPSSAFGIVEAQRHRSRGITLSMFLGLMKYYRQSYIDLVTQSQLGDGEQNRLYVERFFDNIEIGFCMEWCSQTDNKKITELQSANKELVNDKNKYWKLFESLPDAVILYDKEKQPMAFNSVAIQLLKDTADPRQSCYDCSSPPNMSYPVWIMELSNFSLIDTQEITFGKEIDTLKGKRWLEVRRKGTFDVIGNFSGFIVILTDISRRKRVEDNLSRTTKYYENILNTVADPIFVKDRQHRWVYVNDAYCSFKGRSRAELLGKSNRDVDPEKETAVFWKNDDFVFNTGKENISEEESTDSKGLVHLTVTKKTLYTNEEGEKFVVGVIRDITKRRQAEHQILLAKEEWEKTMDCVSDVVLLTDKEGSIKRCNKSLKELVGQSYAELLGRNWRELLTEHGMQKIPPSNEGTEIFHSLTQRWFTINFYPFTGMAYKEESAGMVITLQDTTELKLTQSKILQQEKMAAIGQLAAGVAHEINNPTGFIMSNLVSLQKYAERLIKFRQIEDSALSELPTERSTEVEQKRKELKIDFILEDMQGLARESLDGAERIKKIVQDLKIFSRVDEAELKLADINSGLESTVNIVWNELKYKATVKREYGNIPKTKCNQGQLNQVFMNILVNAAQAIAKQGEITVKTWMENDLINILISDTGCGIPKDKLNRIFEPFYTTKEVGKGTGLGLSIAHDIVKKHNGSIEVQSTEGNGTTFTVAIPVVTA
jgi:PAS domain S-box-containing protein